jgi:hypothetical protein
MTVTRIFAALGFCCALALPQSQALADADARPAASLRSLDLDDVKIQWFSHGDEELPAWISAQFDVGPMGQISGTMTEVELAADGNDEDGDPYGFETNVFDTADGTLKDVSFDHDRFAFTAIYQVKDGGLVHYSGRRSDTVMGEWNVSAVGTGPKGDSEGHNRFPLASDEKKEGTLEIYTEPAAQDPQGTESL